MARQRHTMAEGEVLSLPALTVAADWKCIKGRVNYMPRYSDDTEDEWPGDYEGLQLYSGGDDVTATLPGERLHVLCKSRSAVIEIYEQGV